MIKITDLRNIRIFQTIKALWQRLRPQKIMHTAELVVKPRTILDEDDLTVGGLANAVSIHDMLDYLPGYFDDLKALRKYDPSTYSIMSKLGGVVIPENSLFRHSTLIPKLLDNPSMRLSYQIYSHELR